MMVQPVETTRTSLTASELRGQAVKIKDGTVVRRVLAIALLLEGHSRDVAARMNGMTRQTLRDWVHRHNAEGVALVAHGYWASADFDQRANGGTESHRDPRTGPEAA
jgi:Winged helix-turn helix